jgi:hypothetical protein
MPITNTRIWVLFERRSGTAFLAAGGVWIIDSAYYALDLYVRLSNPTVVGGTLLFTALLLTLAGMLGFYALLIDATPRLALAGTLLVAGAGIVTIVTGVWAVGAALLNQPMPPGIALALILLPSILALVLFGAANVRTNAPSRKCGVFLLTLAATWALWVALGISGANPEWGPVAFGVAFSGITVSLGYVRHASTTSVAHKARSSAPTTR